MAKRIKSEYLLESNRLFRPKVLILLGFLLLLVFLIAIFHFNRSNPNNKSEVEAVSTSAPVAQTANIKVAASSTSPSPSLKPVSTIPVSSGRSVRVPILMYHYIGNNPNPADKVRDSLSTAPDKFQAQMDYLSKNGFTTISLDTLYAALKGGGLPSKPIVLTFDDGYIDFYINAFPILRAHNFHATSFIPTGLVGGGYYMNWGQISEIQSSGLVSFEAHSVHHSNLPSLSASAQAFEINQSKKDLQAHLGVPVNFFAYPYGTSNSTSWNLVKQAGFFGSVGTWYGKVESEGTQYDWPRIRISGGLSLADFASKVN